MKQRVLTGDRITGKLHIGHYAGSLRNRVALQDDYDCFVMLADVQALTTHFDKPEKLRGLLREVTLDYLAAGIDPLRTTMFVQSMIPEIAELTVYFSMFVTVNALRHNPTIKSESRGGRLDDLYYGFLGYPISQTADIAFCKATVIPVGDDQLPHIELTRKIVRRFNELYAPVLVEPQALLGDYPRLPGTDGNVKMGKSLGNAIELDSSDEQVAYKIRRAVTDPARVRVSDCGNPAACPIYAFHRAFRAAEDAAEIRESCEGGTISCSGCKQLITARLTQMLEPMQERRAHYAARPADIDDMLAAGTARAQAIAKSTMAEVREAMHMNYFG